jgi:hypothetical protein
MRGLFGTGAIPVKLLGVTATVPRTVEGSLIPTLPRHRTLVDKITDSGGSGTWYDGRVTFISKDEAVVVPTRCRATNVFAAAARMPRAAKFGLPKRHRRGDFRITRVLVEMVEHAHTV